MGGPRTGLVAAVAVGCWLLGWAGPLASPARGAGPDCPAPPYSASKLHGVPEAQRAACFGRTEITFVAVGGQVQQTIPGVEIAAFFGSPMWFETGTEGMTVGGWKALSLDLGEADQTAFDHTSPGSGLSGWTNVWWRVSGHFDDPASSGCRSAGDSQFPYTPAEAVAFCRNLFLIDGLTWLRIPPTDTSPEPVDSGDSRGMLRLLGLSAAMVAAVLLVPVVLERRRRPTRPGSAG